MFVETGFWPGDIDFDHRELATTVAVMNQRAKEAQRASKRKH